MELHDDTKKPMTSRERYLSIAVPVLCFGGTALGILLWRAGYIRDPGAFYWGCIAGAILLAYLAWLKPRRDIVSLLAPLYAVLIFLLPLENKPTTLLQLLFGASLTILVVRLNLRFSTPVKRIGDDPMEKYLYDYMHRITPLYRGIDREIAHDVASAVLSFKFGLYPNTISSADQAITRLTGEGPIATLKKALRILRDRATSLEEFEIREYSKETFGEGDDPYLALKLTPEQVENFEDFTLDNSMVLCYAVAYLYSPDDGQMLDEHQNFILQILNPYKELLGL
ncbi:MAG TPA: hypothetical protein PK154_01690 [Methanoregulaceae archaeon]|nr:hypothetical protein [Methanoregulaceae archaeon]HPW09805.1 hypothetical protein [Methanoregulaceae archaeon]